MAYVEDARACARRAHAMVACAPAELALVLPCEALAMCPPLE